MVGLEPAHKKEFQIERMILFSDAVFAIAITLLIIEIKAPHAEDKTSLTLWISLINMIPKFIGFFISFMVIGIYWITHHKLFGFVKDYDTKLLWLNLFFLLTIVFMPFSSALYSENINVNLAFIIYCLNVVASGMINLWLWRYVGNPEKNLADTLTDPELLDFFSFRAITIPSVFAIAILLSFISPHVAKASPIFIFPIIKFGNKKFAHTISKYKRKD